MLPGTSTDYDREQFADDLAQAARLLRDGTSDHLAAFVSRDAEARGGAATERASGTRISEETRLDRRRPGLAARSL